MLRWVQLWCPCAESDSFSEGQKVKMVFRPEDVSLSTTSEVPSGHVCIAKGIVESTNFVGAYERVRLRIDLLESGACETNETPYYLTTERPRVKPQNPLLLPVQSPRPAL
jgi:ABC-type Fe3+/spermidine/putrescine transport system ATPase subunit